MPIWKAVLFGIIQGITSVLPISSSGHLALLGHLLGENGATSLSFMVLMHLGTLLAFLWTFRRDLRRLGNAFLRIVQGGIRNIPILLSSLQHPTQAPYHRVITGNYKKWAALLLVTLFPGCGAALCLRRFSFLGATNLLITAMGFFTTALLLLVSSFTTPTKQSPRRTRYLDAFWMGLLQGVSIIPGLSRLGICLSGGALFGLTRPYRLRFAYLMGIPAMIGSILFLLPSAQAQTAPGVGFGAALVGILVSALVSGMMLRWLKRVLSHASGRGFAMYCLAIGLVCIISYFH